MHLGFVNVVTLRIGHQHVSATHVAVFGMLKNKDTDII
jgi:hypothetical protein